MSAPAGNFMLGVLGGAACLAGSLNVSAMAQGASPPNFAPNSSIGWYAYNRLFIPPASGPGPVVQDSALPYVSNDEFRVTGRQPTQRVADLNSGNDKFIRGVKNSMVQIASHLGGSSPT